MDSSLNRLRLGYVFVVLAAVLWAASGALAKSLFNAGVSPLELVQMRSTIAAVLLVSGLGIFRPGLLRIAPKDIPYFLVLGTVGMAAAQFTYLYSISRINVGTAVLIQYLAPSFIAIHGILFARERLSAGLAAALLLALLGCYLVVGGPALSLHGLDLAGMGSALLSALAFAWYSIHGEYGMRRYDSWTVTAWAISASALTFNLVQPPLAGFLRDYTRFQWEAVLFIGTFGTLVPFTLYFLGVRRIRATRASITATLEPITAALLAFLFLGEIMTPIQVAGGGFVILSILLLQIRPGREATR